MFPSSVAQPLPANEIDAAMATASVQPKADTLTERKAKEELDRLLAQEIRRGVKYVAGDFVAENMEAAYYVAQEFFRSRLYIHITEGLETRDAISRLMVVIANGRRMNVGAHAACSNTYILKGKLCMYGDQVVAAVRLARYPSGKPKARKLWHEYSKDGQACTFFAERIHEDGDIEVVRGDFTMEDAKNSQLLKKDTWIGNPKRMLMNRARAFALRDGFADVLNGVAVYEEMQDLEEEAKNEREAEALARLSSIVSPQT